MKAVFSTILNLILVSIILEFVMSQSPPQLLSNSGHTQKIISPGTSVTLPCPVHGDRDDMMFEWYKDKESLMTFGGHRLRVNANGALRIKETIPDDTGVYTCRAVNGFGSVEHNTTLVILGDDEDYQDINDAVDGNDFSVDSEDTSTHKISPAAKPHLLYVTEWDRPQLHKRPGASVRFHCVATGYPRPRLIWKKDGSELPRSVRRGRWSLRLQNLQLSDSGNYTCLASNVLGTASHSFVIDVTTSPESTRGKPELTGTHPSNITVEEGQMAMFQCIVRSDGPPHIEWLKRVEAEEMNQEEFRDVIKVGDENFRVIKSSEVMDRSDGSFLNKLVIQEAEERDSGKYICLGANTNGYSYRSAFLDVLPRPTSSSSTESIPFPIVVAVIVVGVATIAGVVALLIYCRNRQSTSSRGSTTAVPMVTKDAFLPMQRGAPRCGAISYEPPRNRPKHQVTVYVPNCAMNTVH